MPQLLPPPCFGMENRMEKMRTIQEDLRRTDRESRQDGKDQAEMGKKLKKRERNTKSRIRKAGIEKIKNSLHPILD